MTKQTKKSPSKIILDKATGIVRPGEFLAIMGPSGAGKTTLLNCLSGRYQKNLIEVSGEVLLNGRLIKTLDYRAMIGFVPQDDILMENMTPRESLDFSAAMTMQVTKSDRMLLVNNMIEELGLTACADSLIGGHITRGISGGEKKRTSIGVELIFNPSVLFLDEPTTGLDSFTALQIIQLLEKLTTEKNSTIIATIHQPSSQIFNSFDRLLLLSRGASVYMGRANGATEFFHNIGFPLSPNYNPSDHYMKVLSGEKLNDPQFRESILNKIVYKNSIDGSTEKEEPKAHFQISSFYAFFFLIQRASKEVLRNPLLLKTKFMKLCILSAFCCMTFSNLGTGIQEIQDRYGALFMLVNNTLMEALASTVATFQTVKPVFLREYFNRKYGVVPFFLSYTFASLPVEMMFTFGMYTINYFAMGLNHTVSHFFACLGIGALGSLCGSGYGLLASIIAPSMEVASALVPLLFIPMMLSGGYLVSYSHIPVWFFMQYISPFRYTLEGMIRNEFEDNPDLSSNVSKTAIDNMDMPEDLSEAVLYSALLMISIRIVSVILMKVVNRKV